MKTLSNLYWWVLHRTTRRYNIVKLNTLTPTYWDADTRLLHAIMNLVVDFVEIEQAALAPHMVSPEKIAQKDSKIPQKDSPTITKLSKYFPKAPFRNIFSKFFRRLAPEPRSRELGLASLDAQISAKEVPSHQRKMAKVIKEVYLWWTDERLVRPSVEDASGWTKFCENARATPELWDDKAQLDKLLADGIELEKKYLKKDKDMMKKVIDVFEYLWT